MVYLKVPVESSLDSSITVWSTVDDGRCNSSSSALNELSSINLLRAACFWFLGSRYEIAEKKKKKKEYVRDDGSRIIINS